MGSQITKGDIKTIERIERSTADSPRQVSNDADLESETIMKTEELSGKRKRAPTKAFVPAESQKKMRVSKREKGKVRYSKEDDSGSEEEDYEVKFIVDDRYIKGKRQFKVRWVNYGPKDDTWVSEADMSCPRLVEEFEEKKKDKEEEDEDDDDDAADYEVEECIDVREVRGKKEFLIKWKNFTPRHNTWEPESNLDCPQLMKKCLEKKSGKATASSSKKSPKKAAAKTKKASPKKGAKKGRKSAKNGKKSDDEAEEHEEEAAEDEVEDKEAEAGNDEEETKEDETEEATKEEGEDEEESKNDADDEDDDKVEDKRRSKPGPKSKKKK